MLEYRCKNNQRWIGLPLDYDHRRRYGKIDRAVEEQIQWSGFRRCRYQFHFKARLTKITFLSGSVIPGKLELMLPSQLKPNTGDCGLGAPYRGGTVQKRDKKNQDTYNRFTPNRARRGTGADQFPESISYLGGRHLLAATIKRLVEKQTPVLNSIKSLCGISRLPCEIVKFFSHLYLWGIMARYNRCGPWALCGPVCKQRIVYDLAICVTQRLR